MPVRSLLLLLIVSLSTPVSAQGLRISTQVFDLASAVDTASPPMISASLSLFHNGRTYDLMESAGEVVILDPTERQFVILNEARKLRTTLNFDEISQLLETRLPRTEQYLNELARSEDPEAGRIARSVRFQLDPVFSSHFDPMTGRLELTSRSFVYRVDTHKWDDPAQVERYLAAADWTARLNALLHPNSLFPEPRLALNDALRELGDRMPVRVELDLRPDDEFRLRATHRLTTQLSEDDYARIARWSGLARPSSPLRTVAFRSYQQQILVSGR
jgi:hypothetical protein